MRVELQLTESVELKNADLSKPASHDDIATSSGPQQTPTYVKKTSISVSSDTNCTKQEIVTSIDVAETASISSGCYVADSISSSPVSERSTPGIWDYEDTAASTPNSGNNTPTTPPSKIGLFANESPESPLTRKSKGGSVSATNTFKLESVVEDDGSPPQKIFRGVTFMLNDETQRLKKTHERQWTLTPDLDFSNDQHVPIISESKKTSVRVAAETSNRSPAKTTSTQNKNRKKDNMAKVLSEILPHDLHGGIANQRSICVAYLVKDPGRRCGDKVKDSQEFGQSLSVLKEHHGRKDYTALLIQTKILLPKFLCKRHYNCAQRRYGFVESLIQHHCVVEEASKDDPYGFISDPSYSRLCWTQFLSWIDIVCQQVTNNQGPVPETLEIKTSVKTASSITVTSQKPAKLKAASSKKDQTNSFTEPRVSWLTCFTVWQPTWSKYLSVSQALEKQAQRPLLKTEIPPGYIYMYWVKGNFGLAKIGYSTDIDRRLREWRKQCKQDCQLQKSAGPGQCLRVLVPHARRLENLIHAELKELRGKMFCKVCGTNHREWFEVSEGHAVAVYLKWKDWIMQSPYERVEDGLWKLKEDVADSLEEVCRPLEHVDNDMLRKKSVQKRKEVRVSQYWKPKTRLRKWKT